MRISDWSSDVCSSDLISPQQIRAAIVRRSAGIAKLEADGEQLMRELGWREFAHHLLVHFPQTPDTPLQGKFADMPWRKPRDYAADLNDWQDGRTGIPIVHDGMRELWTTCRRHKRGSMINAPLLQKNQHERAW